MSVAKRLLNAWLRATEKPHLKRAKNADAIRRSFAFKAWLLFHGPRGMRHKACTLGGRPGLEIFAPDTSNGPVVLYFHGGAYVFGSPKTHSAMLATLAKQAGGTAFLQDYRKAPEDPFPAATEDALGAWQDLLERGLDPKNCIIGGDSAGGGLALALLGVLLKENQPLPAGVFAFSPLTDMTFSGESMRTNKDADVVLPAERIQQMADVYLNTVPPEDPRASPLFADLTGAPPVYLAVGDTEVLLDDTVRLHERLVSQGVVVSMKVANDLPHVWPLFHNILPEARATLTDLADWIRRTIKTTNES